MTYNKEKLLKTLANVPLYDGTDFNERMNDDILHTIDDFNKFYYYAHGATKLAIIPLKEEEDYVIKIPYTGIYEHNYSNYNSNSHSFEDNDTYFNFYGGDADERPWDYCLNEVKRYNIAKQKGFSYCFAKTELLGYINNYPIYIQEKCTPFHTCKKNHIYTHEDIIQTSIYCNDDCRIHPHWLTDFRFYYNGIFLSNFIYFIHHMGWDDDLRDENIGYIKDRPVILDYSGFAE